MSILFKLVQIYVFTFTSALWARYVISPAKSGFLRIILGAPIVIANCLAPLIFDPIHEFTAFTCYLLLLVWLANFKVGLQSLDDVLL